MVAPGGHAGLQVVLQRGALGYRLGIQAGERLRFAAHPRQPDAIGHRQVVEGGVDAAEEQMKAKQYAEPFKADKRKVIALAIEFDDRGKGLVDWKEV